MSTVLKASAAGWLVIILASGGYLRSTSAPIDVAAVPEGLRIPAHGPGQASQAPSLKWRPVDLGSSSDPRAVNLPPGQPGTVVRRPGHQPQDHNLGTSSPHQKRASWPITATPRVRFTEQTVKPAASPKAGRTPAVGSFTVAEASRGEAPPLFEMAVPFGAVLPATFLDTAVDATPAQIATLDRIASDFVQEATAEDHAEANAPAKLAAAGGKRGKTAPRPSWNTAAAHANEQYRLLFGVEAYNARTTAAAREALDDSRE